MTRPTAHNTNAPLLATIHVYAGLSTAERRWVADWLRLEARRVETEDVGDHWSRCVGDEVAPVMKRPLMPRVG